MKEKDAKRTKWLHIRLSEKEHHRIQQKFQKTTSKKVSDFARKVLLDKAVTVNTRNQSLDEMMAVLIDLRAELNAIGTNYNQLIKKLHQMNHVSDVLTWLAIHESARKIMQSKIDEIKAKINAIDEVWLQS